MPQERLEPGGRPPKHLLEPQKGADGIFRLNRIRHRAFNGEYTRTSGSGRNKKECLADWEQNFEKNRRKGSILADDPVSEFLPTDPMSKAFERFLEQTQARVDRGKIVQRTCDTYRRAIHKGQGRRAKSNTIRLGSEMGNLTIAEAGKPAFLARYLDKLVAIAPGLAQRHHVVLKGTFAMLTLAGLFDVSPMAPVPKPEGNAPSQRALTRRERDQLYRQICGRIKRAEYFRILYLTILGTGIRPGEAFALWWEDILDLEDATMDRAVMRVGTTMVPGANGRSIRQNKRKHGTEGECYYLTLPAWLTTELRAWKKVCKPKSEQTHVFLSGRKTSIEPATAEANLLKSKADSPLTWVTWGNLRDTVATHVTGKTGDTKRASAQLGHSEGASVAVRHYIDRNGYIQSVVDNADVLEDLNPVKTGSKLE